jgi:two-component system, LytTR family, sensor kinase
MMQKQLLQSLIKAALITIPILALYGITPIYLFNAIPTHFVIRAFFLILSNVTLFWLINIALVHYIKNRHNWKRYVFSYAFSFLIPFLLTGFIDPPKEVEQYTRFSFFYPFLSVLAINTLINIVINFLFLRIEKEITDKEFAELKFAQIEAQQQILTQQMQPHFLFNTLSVLKSLIHDNPKEAEQYTVRLSNFLRYSIQANMQTNISLQQELAFCADYIALQKMRFGTSLQFEQNIPAEKHIYLLPAYALQTLIENAIKHNRFTEKNPLCISLTCKDDSLILRNNKNDYPSTESTGVGLRNLEQRFLLSGKQSLIIEQNENEFTVILPLLQPQKVLS